MFGRLFSLHHAPSVLRTRVHQLRNGCVRLRSSVFILGPKLILGLAVGKDTSYESQESFAYRDLDSGLSGVAQTQSAPPPAPPTKGGTGQMGMEHHNKMKEMHKQHMEAMKADVDKMKASLEQLKANVAKISDHGEGALASQRRYVDGDGWPHGTNDEAHGRHGFRRHDGSRHDAPRRYGGSASANRTETAVSPRSGGLKSSAASGSFRHHGEPPGGSKRDRQSASCYPSRRFLAWRIHVDYPSWISGVRRSRFAGHRLKRTEQRNKDESPRPGKRPIIICAHNGLNTSMTPSRS